MDSVIGRAEVEAAVATIPVWRHRIELPHGVVTPGTDDTALEWSRLALPNRLDGAQVLDVGCSDGYFAFACERRGATTSPPTSWEVTRPTGGHPIAPGCERS